MCTRLPPKPPKQPPRVHTRSPCPAFVNALLPACWSRAHAATIHQHAIIHCQATAMLQQLPRTNTTHTARSHHHRCRSCFRHRQSWPPPKPHSPRMLAGASALHRPPLPTPRLLRPLPACWLVPSPSFARAPLPSTSPLMLVGAFALLLQQAAWGTACGEGLPVQPLQRPCTDCGLEVVPKAEPPSHKVGEHVTVAASAFLSSRLPAPTS